ncbi:carbohydrate ABC transporter permease [Oscillospiraceae bacterium HV4-5-C5C]|nr:carbohydrate ABC transporter permease [Oscillospiraceae bacterium HV4-5-C5C]
MKQKASKRSNNLNRNTWGDYIIIVIMLLVAFITLYPMYYVFLQSISDPLEVAAMNVYFYPKGFFLKSYGLLVKDSQLWHSYGYTFFYVISGTILTLFTSVTSAYVLNAPKLIGKKWLIVFLLIPMYFSGGLIPSFLLITKLGLYNTVWALVLPSSYNITYIILTKTFFSSIPYEMTESAKIDGANHYRILGQIYLPLAKPILAVVAIYTIVGIWNSWFPSLVYQPNMDIQPLQMYLRRILIEQSVDLTNIGSMQEAEAMARLKLSNSQLKYSVIILTTLPIIFVYPFFQKYFVKGVMIGSLKG